MPQQEHTKQTTDSSRQTSYTLLDPSMFPEKSKHPVIVVVDEFSFKNIDVDGDQRNIADTYMGEISHGEVVVAHIKTILPDAKIIQLNSGNYEVFNELSRLKAQGKQIDAVNFSASATHANFSQNGWKVATGIEVTPANAKEKRDAVKDALSKLEQQDENLFLKKVGQTILTIRALESLTSQGVPVYLGAGNSGETSINAYLFAEGIEVVSSTNAKGFLSSFSGDNSLVTRKARGEFNSVPVLKDGNLIGYDITANGLADIVLPKTTAKGTYRDPVLQKFSGRKISEVLTTKEELVEFTSSVQKKFGHNLSSISANRLLGIITEKNDTLRDLSNPLEEKLIPVKDLLTKTGYEDTEASRSESQHARYIHLSGLLFDVDDNGVVYHTNDGSSTPGVAGVSGTSFSSPRALAHDIRQKMR